MLKKASLLIIASSENDNSKTESILHHSIIGSSRNLTLCGKCFFWKKNALSSFSTKDHFTVTCALHLLPSLSVHPTRTFHIYLCLYTIHEEMHMLQTFTYPCGTISFGVQQLIGGTLDGTFLQQTDSSVLFHGKLKRNLTPCILAV